MSTLLASLISCLLSQFRITKNTKNNHLIILEFRGQSEKRIHLAIHKMNFVGID